MVKIVRTSDQVPDFCRKVCAKLECCPNLFSPLPVTENCSENCSSHTKTKYAYYYGKRRKVVKSSPSEESTYSLESRHNLSDCRKMRKPILTLERSCPSAADLHRAGSSEENDEEEADTPWSEEINPELQDDLTTDASSEEMSLAIPVSTMKLRSSRGSIHVARPESDEQALKALSFLRAQSERTRQIKQAAEEMLILESNPLDWTVTDVVQFLRLTDCASLAKIFQEQDIDGQALLLLTLPTVQECMELKLGPAIKLCHQIERVKLAFYAQYAN